MLSDFSESRVCTFASDQRARNADLSMFDPARLIGDRNLGVDVLRCSIKEGTGERPYTRASTKSI